MLLDHALSCVQTLLKYPNWELWNVAVAVAAVAVVVAATVAVDEAGGLFWHSHQLSAMVVQEVGTVDKEAKSGRLSLD